MTSVPYLSVEYRTVRGGEETATGSLSDPALPNRPPCGLVGERGSSAETVGIAAGCAQKGAA
jgi:hypothetical protein